MGRWRAKSDVGSRLHLLDCYCNKKLIVNNNEFFVSYRGENIYFIDKKWFSYNMDSI